MIEERKGLREVLQQAIDEAVRWGRADARHDENPVNEPEPGAEPEAETFIAALAADRREGEQDAPRTLRELVPAEVWKRYDEAVEKAHSVGALKQLKNVEAEIGRLFIRAALAAAAPDTPSEGAQK